MLVNIWSGSVMTTWYDQCSINVRGAVKRLLISAFSWMDVKAWGDKLGRILIDALRNLLDRSKKWGGQCGSNTIGWTSPAVSRICLCLWWPAGMSKDVAASWARASWRSPWKESECEVVWCGLHGSHSADYSISTWWQRAWLIVQDQPTREVFVSCLNLRQAQLALS